MQNILNMIREWQLQTTEYIREAQITLEAKYLEIRLQERTIPFDSDKTVHSTEKFMWNDSKNIEQHLYVAFAGMKIIRSKNK